MIITNVSFSATKSKEVCIVSKTEIYSTVHSYVIIFSAPKTLLSSSGILIHNIASKP